MPDRPKPRGASYRHKAGFLQPWSLPAPRRNGLVRRGVSEDLIIGIETRLTFLVFELRNNPPTPAEVMAALRSLEQPATQLLNKLWETDAETMAELRKHCDLLEPTDPAYVGQIGEDLAAFLKAIDDAGKKIAKLPKPLDPRLRVAIIVGAELLDRGLDFDAKPKGHASALMSEILAELRKPGDVRHWIKQAIKLKI